MSLLPSNPVPMVIAALVALFFISDGYRPNPRWRWGNVAHSRPISLRSHWTLGGYLIGLAWMFDPAVKVQLPSSLPRYALIGLLPLVFLLMLLDARPFVRRPYIRPLRSDLSRAERQQLRRERKQERLRRTQARRDG